MLSLSLKSVFSSSKLKIYTISFLAYSGILYTVLMGIAMYCVLNHAGYFTSSKVWLMFFIAVVLSSLQFCIYYLFTSLICVKKTDSEAINMGTTNEYITCFFSFLSFLFFKYNMYTSNLFTGNLSLVWGPGK